MDKLIMSCKSIYITKNFQSEGQCKIKRGYAPMDATVCAFLISPMWACHFPRRLVPRIKMFAEELNKQLQGSANRLCRRQFTFSIFHYARLIRMIGDSQDNPGGRQAGLGSSPSRLQAWSLTPSRPGVLLESVKSDSQRAVGTQFC